MNDGYEWVGPQANVVRMTPLTGVPLEGDNAFDARRVTGYQLLVTTSGAGALYVDPARLVSPEDRARIGFVKHSPTRNRWERIISTEEDGRHRIAITTGGLYAMTLNVLSESRYVDDAVSTFPGWYAAVEDRNSNLRQLANIPASVFEDITEGLSEARRRATLEAIPSELIWRTFRYESDGLDRIESIVVKEEKNGQTTTLSTTEDVGELYYTEHSDVILHDRSRSVIHRLSNEGEVLVEGIVDGQPFSKRLNGRWVNIFNEFDEIGLLFGLPRLENEDNHEYRNRIRTLFTHPGDATKYGIVREIARRVGNFTTLRWVNTDRALMITNPEGRAYCIEDVTLDGEVIKTEPMPDGGFVIPPTNSMTPHEVVFHWGTETYTLGRHRLDEHGRATNDDLDGYRRWAIEAPVLYGGIRFDRQEWDMVNDESLIELMPVTDQKMERWD